MLPSSGRYLKFPASQESQDSDSESLKRAAFRRDVCGNSADLEVLYSVQDSLLGVWCGVVGWGRLPKHRLGCCACVCVRVCCAVCVCLRSWLAGICASLAGAGWQRGRVGRHTVGSSRRGRKCRKVQC